MARGDLTLKQKMFIEHYLATSNATEAARQAGYRGDDGALAVEGARALRNAKVAAAIEKRVQKTKKVIGADEVLEILTAQARGDIGDFARPDGTLMTVIEAKKAGVSRLLKRVEMGESGATKIELHDAQAASTTLGKYHGLWKEDAPNNDHVQAFVSEAVRAVSETLNEYIDDTELRERIKAQIADRLDGCVSR